MTEAIPIPTSADEFTPEWLTGALRSSGVTREGNVVSATPEATGEGAGFVGELWRIKLTYDREEPGAPASLIVKLPAANPVVRAVTEAARFSEREVRFYREIAPSSPIRVPRCYFSGMDVAAGRYALLLEDMAPARAGDQLACSVDDADRAVRAIAMLHATWWRSPRLSALAWMPALTDVHPSAADWWQTIWNRAAETHAALLSPRMQRFGERAGASCIRALQLLGDAPPTLVHGDYKTDNVFYLDDGSVAAFDFQLTTIGAGMFDVAFFLSGSLNVDDRRAHEGDLVRAWYDEIVRGGVSDYTFDTAWRDYRLSVVYSLSFTLIASFMIDTIGNGPTDFFETRFKRATAAIDDLDAAALLDD